MSAQLRPNVTDSNGVTRRWCSTCHEYKVLDHENFQWMIDKRWSGEKSKAYWSRKCRACLRNRRTIKHGHVYPIAKYRKYIDWMIGVVGWNETYRRIGVTKGTLYYWMGNAKKEGKVLRRITTPSAQKIILAVAELRREIDAGIIVPLEEHTAAGHCRGCGVMTDSDDFTDGCKPCKDRKAKRKLRADNEDYRLYERERAQRRRDAAQIAA